MEIINELASWKTVQNGVAFLTGKAPQEGDGSSGGPWFSSIDLHHGRNYGLGTLIGDTGGYHGGGPSSGVPSYSSHWTSAFLGLMKAAQKAERREYA
jgi:hypothetical protein